MSTSTQSGRNTITFLFKKGQALKYKKGELILQASTPPKGLYCISSGLVKVYSLNNQGEEYLHIIYGPGEIFPVFWMFDKNLRGAYMQAITDVTINLLPKKTVLDWVQHDAQISYTFLQQISRQFNLYADRLDNLEYKYASERLSYRLLYLAARFGKPDGSTIVLPPVTQLDIARSINLSRESANREIERLCKKGLVSHRGRSLVLHDIVQLTKELHGGINPEIWGLQLVRQDLEI